MYFYLTYMCRMEQKNNIDVVWKMMMVCMRGIRTAQNDVGMICPHCVYIMVDCVFLILLCLHSHIFFFFFLLGTAKVTNSSKLIACNYMFYNHYQDQDYFHLCSILCILCTQYDCDNTVCARTNVVLYE